jgi:FkbM family methyltransferase
MNITELKRRFKAGEIEKPAYIESILAFHQALFEYASFLRDTEIECIEITDTGVRFKLRDMPYEMECPPSQARVAPIEILNFDEYEPAETGALARLLQGCSTILDVGANIGWFSLWFAHRLQTATIHAFEPLPDNFQFLARNIAANHLGGRVLLYPYGLSDRAGTFDFYSYPTGSTNASLLNVSGAGNAVKVIGKTVTLDSWVRETGTAPDLLKCDVEGAELLVFKGGEATIARHRPIVFTEMLRKWSKPFGYHPNDVLKFFERLGYGCHSIGPRGLASFGKMTDASIETNFVFLHKQHHEHLLRELQG